MPLRAENSGILRVGLVTVHPGSRVEVVWVTGRIMSIIHCVVWDENSAGGDRFPRLCRHWLFWRGPVQAACFNVGFNDLKAIEAIAIISTWY